MKRFIPTAFSILVLACPALAQEQDDFDLPVFAEPSCFNDKVRISALISTGDKVKVGIVETSTKASYLISPGEFAGEVEVIEADYEKETVTLKLGAEICTLNLASDPNAVHYAQNLAPPADNVYRGEAIEQFLKENPNAMKEGIIKFPLPVMPDAVGKGEGIEAFLRANPDLAAQADRPVVGKGEGIENFLRDNPEIKVQDEIPAGSFGPGIDEELRKHPEMLTNQAAGSLLQPPAEW